MTHSVSRLLRWLLLLIVVTILPMKCFAAPDVKTYVPKLAEVIMPLVQHEIQVYYPELEKPWYVGALAEHESCIHLTHQSCWWPEARFKNNREESLGLFQIARSWDAQGRLRFDNVAIYSKRYPYILGDMRWENIGKRYDFQIRAALMMLKELDKKFESVKSFDERLRMMDSAYNGGAGHVQQAREICKITRGCDPNIWYDNVETYLPKSKVKDPRYGGRSLFQVNTGHVKDVTGIRMPKYERFFQPQ